MFRTTSLALIMLFMGAGCGLPLSLKSPVYWHEGEQYAGGPRNAEEGVGDKAPASGGKALIGLPLKGRPGFVSYKVKLPRQVADARLLLRYSRFHYVPMDPSKVDILLASGSKQIKRTVVLDDTGGWGAKNKSDWGMLSVDVGTLAAGTWQLTFSSAVERRGDINIDGFFIAPGSVKITAAELAAADRIDINGARYVGLSLAATTIRQDKFAGFDLIGRGFVPHSLDAKVTLLDSNEKQVAVLHKASEVPLSDAPTVLKVSGEPLHSLADGAYIIRAQWQSAPALDVPIQLVGQLAAGFDERLSAIEAFHAKLQGSNVTGKEVFLLDYEHAIEFLKTSWQDIMAGQAGPMVVAGLKRTLVQYELTGKLISQNRNPYAGRTGDLRLAFRSKTSGKLEPYRLVLPDSYRTDGKRPVFMALNGTEDRFLDRGDAVKRIANQRGYAIISPRASSGYWGQGRPDLVQVVEHVLKEFSGLDQTRVYCTGTSAGGFGTYSLATTHPQLFAAIACVSGVGNYRRLARRDRELIERFTTVPTLILHGEVDTLVPPAIAEQVAGHLEKLGYPYELHIFPSHGHSYTAYAEQYLPLTLDYFDRYSKKP